MECLPHHDFMLFEWIYLKTLIVDMGILWSHFDIGPSNNIFWTKPSKSNYNELHRLSPLK